MGGGGGGWGVGGGGCGGVGAGWVTHFLLNIKLIFVVFFATLGARGSMPPNKPVDTSNPASRYDRARETYRSRESLKHVLGISNFALRETTPSKAAPLSTTPHQRPGKSANYEGPKLRLTITFLTGEEYRYLGNGRSNKNFAGSKRERVSNLVNDLLKTGEVVDLDTVPELSGFIKDVKQGVVWFHRGGGGRSG